LVHSTSVSTSVTISMRSIPSIPEKQWHQIAVSPKVSKRSGHTMVKKGGNIYIYAGYSGETRFDNGGFTE
jgi:hypothetical protein